MSTQALSPDPVNPLDLVLLSTSPPMSPLVYRTAAESHISLGLRLCWSTDGPQRDVINFRDAR